jgi:hypothetical protein
MADGLRQQIPNSILIVRNGVGHASYQTFGETSAVMDDFLMNGKLPIQGTTYDSRPPQGRAMLYLHGSQVSKNGCGLFVY